MTSIPARITNKMTIVTAFSLILMLDACKDDEPNVTKVVITSLSPESPASLKYYKTDESDEVLVTYDYMIVQPEGVRIWIEPRSSSSFTGTYYYSPSPIIKGNGTRSVIVSVTADKPSLPIDGLEIVVKNPDTGAIILNYTVDVDYTFTE